MDKNRIYTVKEIARLLGFSTNTVYKYLDEGKIKATRLGKEGRFRIPQTEVAKLLGLEGEKPQIVSALKPEESQNLETRKELYEKARNEISESSEEIQPDRDLLPRSRLPEILIVSAMMFLVLIILGIRNINVSASKSHQALPSPSSPDKIGVQSQVNRDQIGSVPTPEVLSETEEIKTEESLPSGRQVKPKSILTVKLDDESLSVNIREQPATDSAKIGKARDGDTFEFVSKEEEWYEVKLASGSGFISADYIIEEEVSN